MAGPSARTLSAFLWACNLDVAALKPGNVSLASPGHGMEAAQFLASSQAAAAALCEPGRRVGDRIEAAVCATRAAVSCNTNLGIVLLCAPLAAAVERWRPSQGVAGLRAAVEAVMSELDLLDARAAYRGIALARPGGLGSAPQQDVAQPPTLGLRDAMALAADRDRIAFQYLHAHADLFDLGLPAFGRALQAAPAASLPDEAVAVPAMQACFLEFLAAFADSHIVRKYGEAVAHSVMEQALPWRQRARKGEALAGPDFVAWDLALKAEGLNPGTSADLSVASAMLWAVLHVGEPVPQAGPQKPSSGPA